MSRKDYVLISSVIRAETFLSGPLPVVERIIAGLAEAFGQDNPHFNAAKFRKASSNGANVQA